MLTCQSRVPFDRYAFKCPLIFALANKDSSMTKTIIIASVIFVLDAYLFNQGVIAVVFLLLVAPIILIRAVFAWKNTALRKRRLAADRKSVV